MAQTVSTVKEQKMNQCVDTSIAEAFGPSLREILSKIPYDKTLRAALNKDPLSVFRQYGAPVEKMSPAMRTELEDFSTGFDFETAFKLGSVKCSVCEYGIGIAIVAVGGAVLIAAGVALAPEEAIVTAIVAAIAAAGYVIAAATVTTILVGLVAAAYGAVAVIFGYFVPQVCEALGACSPKTHPPLDPEIGKWIGQDILRIGGGPVMVLGPPSQTVFNHTLYLAYVPSSFPNVSGISIASFDINQGTAWNNTGPQPQIAGRSIISVSTPALAGGTVGGADLLFMVYFGVTGELTWCSFDGQSWTSPALVPNDTPVTSRNLQVTAAVINGKLMVCYINDGPMIWYTYDGTTWSDSQTVDSVSASLRPSLVNYGNTPYFVYCDNKDSKIKYIQYSNQLGDWTDPTNTGYQTTVAMSACAYSSKMYLIYRSHHHDFLYWATFDGVKWVHDVLKEPYLSADNKAKLESITTDMGLSIAASDEDQRLFMTYVPDDGSNQLHGTIG